MTRKPIFVALLAALIFTFPLTLTADDVEDARFAEGLLLKYEFLDLAWDQAQSVVEKSSCSRDAKIIAYQVLLRAANWLYEHTTDEDERTRMEADIPRFQAILDQLLGGTGTYDRLRFKFQKAERAAGNYREADKKDKPEYRETAQKEYEALITEIKAEVEKYRKKTRDIEDAMNKIAPEIRTSADARKKYQDLKAELGNLLYPRNSIERLTGEILFSYAMFLKDLDASKTEELFKEVRSRMDIFVNGFYDDENDENDIEERWEFQEISYDAYILLGKSEVFLEKYDDAIEHLKDMLNPPYPGNRESDLSREGGKALVAYKEALVPGIRTEAHRWSAEAHIRKAKSLSGEEKENELIAAIDLIDSLFIKLPNAITSNSGKAACMTQGEALMELERFGEAIVAINKIFARNEGRRMPGAKPTGSQVTAAKEMSKIYETALKKRKASKFKFSSAVSFAVGEGFFWRDKHREATYVLRDVGRGVSTELDRQHEMEALFDLGRAYYLLNEWHESCFAFLELSKKYPDGELAERSIKYAKTAIEATGVKDSVDQEIYNEVMGLFGKLVSGAEEQKSLFNKGVMMLTNAQKSLAKKNLKQAIKSFEEAAGIFAMVKEFVKNVKTGTKTSVNIYGEARFFAGYASMLAYLSSEVKVPALAENALKYFKDSYTWCAAQPKPTAEIRGIEAKSRYRAAEFLMAFSNWPDKQKKDLAGKAIAILTPYDTRLAGEKKYLATVRRIQLVGYLTTEQFGKAGDKFNAIYMSYMQAKAEKNQDEIKIWRKQLISVAENLGDALNRAGDDRKNMGEPEEAKKLWAQAGGYLLKWRAAKEEAVKDDPKQALSFQDLLWMANIIFNSGKVAEAEQVYNDLVTKHEKNLDRLTEDEVNAFWNAKLRLAGCKTAIGKFDQAARQYKDFIDNPPDSWILKDKRGKPIKTRDGKFQLKYITAHKGYADNMYEDFKKTGNKKSLWEAANYYGQILPGIDRDKRVTLYWGTMYRLLECFFELQEYKQVRSSCRRLAADGTLEKLFNDYKKMHRKFLDLWKSANDKLGIKEDKYLDNEEARWNKVPEGPLGDEPVKEKENK